MAEHATDDLQLLLQVRRGNENAFGLLYERHQGQIFRFVMHMTGSKAIAEEVTQEVFMLLIGKPRVYDPARGPLAAYLFGVARNLARRALDNQSLDVSLDNDEELDLAPPLDAEVIERLSNSDALDSLRKALRGLPESYREVIVLCDLEEMSYEQASQILDCPSGTIASRLHRAHNMLRTKLSHAAAKGCQP